MLEILQSFNLTTIHWILLFFCGLIIGFTKTGIAGLGIIAVPLMAGIFPPKISVGILLPILCMADIIAIKHYRHHVQMSKLWAILPWAVVGIILGAFTGKYVSSEQFKLIIAITILISLGLMLWNDYKKKMVIKHQSKVYAIIFGLISGFTTMIGNAAGPIMAIYLLLMALPKFQFIGTRAWFFFLINLIKIPFHVLLWKTITVNTFVLDLMILPAIILGALLGIKTLKYVPERFFRYAIITLTFASAMKLLF